MALMAFKGVAQSALRPVSTAFVRAGISPNSVTLVSILGSVIVGAGLYLLPSTLTLIVVPLWVVVRIALNVIDGMMAREHDLRTGSGALLNECGDLVADVALGLGFAGLPHVDARAVVAFVLAAALAEHAGLAALLVGAERRYDGPLAKPDRLAALSVLAALLAAGVPPGRWTTATFAVLAVLAVLTAARRAAAALREAAAGQ